MMLHLSRLRLSRSPSTRSLRALIDPPEGGARLDAHHRLIWTAFADGPDRHRDFLWRDDGEGRFITLSSRPPAPSDLFELPEIKPFAPDLRGGDRLAFVLRANAVRSLTDEGNGRSPSGRVRTKHRDVVMDLLHGVPGTEAIPEGARGQRADRRLELAGRAAETWLDRQGGRSGFAPRSVAVEHYDAVTLPTHRGKRTGAPRLGILDLTGVIEVTDPVAFLAALASGFGRAKAFGCGLMLIRRA
jgi:CRISPR system Cascade subunit CasE